MSFVDLLCIHGTKHIMNIVHEKINKKDIHKFVKDTEISYSYKDLTEGFLDYMFTKQSDYIRNKPFRENTLIQIEAGRLSDR